MVASGGWEGGASSSSDRDTGADPGFFAGGGGVNDGRVQRLWRPRRRGV